MNQDIEYISEIKSNFREIRLIPYRTWKENKRIVTLKQRQYVKNKLYFE